MWLIEQIQKLSSKWKDVAKTDIKQHFPTVTEEQVQRARESLSQIDAKNNKG